jgi:hypothetical protein
MACAQATGGAVPTVKEHVQGCTAMRLPVGKACAGCSAGCAGCSAIPPKPPHLLHVWEEALLEFIQVADNHVAGSRLLLQRTGADGKYLGHGARTRWRLRSGVCVSNDSKKSRCGSWDWIRLYQSGVAVGAGLGCTNLAHIHICLLVPTWHIDTHLCTCYYFHLRAPHVTCTPPPPTHLVTQLDVLHIIIIFILSIISIRHLTGMYMHWGWLQRGPAIMAQ